MGKAFMITTWVLVVGIIFCICFALWELFIFRRAIKPGAKVQHKFTACPNTLQVAIMGLDGGGKYFNSSTPAVLQDRVNIAYCEGSPCTGFFGDNSSWIRPAFIDTISSQAAAGHQAASRTWSPCEGDEDCFRLATCNLGDPENTTTINGVKYSLLCPLLAGGDGNATPVNSLQWNPLQHGPAQLYGGPMGCPVYDSIDPHASITAGARVPCIANKCAVWLPNFKQLQLQTPIPSLTLNGEICAPHTDPMKAPPQSGKWSVDKSEILQYWGKSSTVESGLSAAAALNREQYVPHAKDGLFVPCDPTTSTCKLYGATGLTGKGPALPLCSTEAPCPTGQHCVTCYRDTQHPDHSSKCPANPDTWSCPVDPTSGEEPASCQVCVGRAKKGIVMRTEFLAEGTVIGHNENGYIVRWDAVQCLYPYRNGKYQRCRIVRSEANKPIWKHIFGTADPTDTANGNGNPMEIKIETGFSEGTFWPLKAVGLQKNELERVYRYSIKNRDVATSPDLGRAPDGSWGKCIPTGGNIFVD